MGADEFNTQYLPKLLSNISKEIKQKDFVLMGDFNIDLLNYTSKLYFDSDYKDGGC